MRVSLAFVAVNLIAVVAMTGLSLGSPAPVSAQVEQQYLLLGANGALPPGLDALVASVGGRVVTAFTEIGVAVVASADPGFPTAAAALPGVQSVVPDGTMGVEGGLGFDEGAVSEQIFKAEGVVAEGVPAVNALQWNLRTIDADQAWSRGFQGRGVKVAVLDTGVDYRHQELSGQVDMVLSRSLVSEAVPLGLAPFMDLALHGTHVASIIAGKGVRFPGVAPQARIISVKVLNKTGYGQESTVIAGILYAAGIRADVINMSLGFVLPAGELARADDGEREWVHSQLLEALMRAISFARRKGSLLVASAGNTGTDLDLNRTTIKAPAGVRPVVGVSATTPLDQLAPFSDYGRRVVYVAAPGTGIFGAANTLYFPPRRDPVTGVLLFAYIAMSGTSQAAAETSGIAALMDSRVAGHLSGSALREMLRRATDDLGPRGRDIYFGYGRINALKGVTMKIRDEHEDEDDD